MRVAVLVKQVPVLEDMSMADGFRLNRETVGLEMNAYCRRAVSLGVRVASGHGSRCTVLTLGPSRAVEVLCEALAWGADDAVLVTDPLFAGSDTLATARALAAALNLCGPFDLVIAGRNSIDADTGQVPPELAELLDLPFAAAIREIEVTGRDLNVLSEDGGSRRRLWIEMPAVISVAERLIQPCKVPLEPGHAIAWEKIRVVTAAELGDGPWGAPGSPTAVGEVRQLQHSRLRHQFAGDVGDQVTGAVKLLEQSGRLEAVRALAAGASAREGTPSGLRVPDPPRPGPAGAIGGVAVVVDPGSRRATQELLGEAAHLGQLTGRPVIAVGPLLGNETELASWGADSLVQLLGGTGEEDIASGLAGWCRSRDPWALLAPSTLWSREVAGRVAARLNAGLTGDAVDLEVRDSHLVAWKPAFGGQLLAAITSRSRVQMVTVRRGALTVRKPRGALKTPVETVLCHARGRVVSASSQPPNSDEPLLSAQVVIGVGTGVSPPEYEELNPLIALLGAELAATRKVTDKGWISRGRQVGLTGHSISPALYIAIGISGKLNHMIGTRSAGTIMAINSDGQAPVFGFSDIGIVGNWHEAVPLLTESLAAVLGERQPAD